MAVDYQPHTYVSFGGRNSETPGNEDEIWQCGVRGFQGTTNQTPVPESGMEDLANAISTPLLSWYTNSASYHPSAAYLDWIKVATIGGNGHYVGAPFVLDGLNTAGTVSDSAPSFLSVCYSFTTGTTFGKARFGRIYPPNWGTPRAGAAYITTAAQADLLAKARQFLDAMHQTGSGHSFYPFVVSSSGVSRPISGVRIGRLWDVQRRRKNAVPNAYSGGAWPS